MENIKKHSNIPDVRPNYRKQNSKTSAARKPEIYLETGKNFKKHRPILPKGEGGTFVECEESLSKLQEISFTKYIHQNLNSKSHGRSEILENKWNGPVEDKLRSPGGKISLIRPKVSDRPIELIEHNSDMIINKQVHDFGTLSPFPPRLSSLTIFFSLTRVR